jgi:hypothetical protein
MAVLGPRIKNSRLYRQAFTPFGSTTSTRPFLQFGAGVQYETNNANEVVGRDLPSNDFRTVFTGIVGAAITIDLGHSAFIRPQVRTYVAPGDNRTTGRLT